MKSWLSVVLAVVLIMGLAVPNVSAQAPATLVLVGTDALADAINHVAPGVQPPGPGESPLPTGVSRNKQDILTLEMATDADNLYVQLKMDAGYQGSSSLIFAVHFKVGGTPFFTCWNVQSVGTTAQSTDVNENSLACSRFSGEAQVGPATRATGVGVSLNADGDGLVLWPVPLDSVDGVAEGMPLTDIVAETWNRGVSTCCLTSGSQSGGAYTFNRADRAPDEGVWTFAPGGGAPAAPSITLALESSEDEVSAEQGSEATFNVTAFATTDAEATVDFNVSGGPENWTVSVEPASATFSPPTTAQRLSVTAQVPADAEEGTVELVLHAFSGESELANLTLRLIVEAAAEETGGGEEASEDEEEAGEEASEDNATEGEEAGSGIPSVGPLAVVTVLAALAVAVRRRLGSS